MSTSDIDFLVTDFYQTLTFVAGDKPDLNALEALFHEEAILINNTFGRPLTFTPEEFAKGIQTKVADGSMEQFMQREVFSKTEVFGKIAQRVSVYEYSFTGHESGRIPRGISYIQCIQTENKWMISSMVWQDENENYLIPHEYHIER
ncbi:hypothetical protein [Mucilaginibacter polytrichastri]|uniref:DUF4440 domain-containing protein n=1 Tax=Mucilaginibacter polytrichastri TaxID=1302689 RepID=A0A1Q5ZW36_9SPHI|nr:hypothetical protein [Mucilaginibacter polytrichastri]OKS85987.1 hypothetical protein RG47T_1434 [Mucilaginibacter polytrichastri]SFS59943.1 hypothetical protein SAMN04487890_102149 [Mucilaginibacter polytrichastri]